MSGSGSRVLTSQNLLYHYVSAGPPERLLTRSLSDLRRDVEAQLQKGRRPVPCTEFLFERVPQGTNFTVSFDDAHASVLLAVPLLRELGVTPTLFVPTAFVGGSDELLDWDDLRRLRDEGWILGSHSHTHVRMGLAQYGETPEEHKRRLVQDELLRSREIMEAELGEAPRLFAYPYGEAPEIARWAVFEAGYSAAFSVSTSLVWNADLLDIPRWDMCAEELPPEGQQMQPIDDGVTGLSVIVPACDRAHILSDVVTRLASQVYPPTSYEVIVVDDGSVEDLTPIFSEMPPNVRLVRQGDGRFRAGQARQRGADEARFPYLVFLDADVAVDPEFLWHFDWVHKRVRDAVVLGYLSGYNLHDQGFLHTPPEILNKELVGIPVIPDRTREPTLRGCLDNLDWIEQPWRLTYTGNMSVPRDLFARVGGFSPDFEGWGLEDIDLGIRLARGGGRFVFGRFALGYHIVEPHEPSRNPFRKRRPRVEDFAGYLANLERLRARHEGIAEVEDFVRRSRADVEETCGRPHTVGVEMGGAARVRNPYHRRLHAVQLGGVPKHELLDRVAYAEKVGAQNLYLLGGEPAEHPSFFHLLEAARGVVSWVAMQSLVHAFAQKGLAQRARDAGLRGVVAMIFAFDRAVHEALHGAGTYAELLTGLEALAGAGIELSAHLVVTRESEAALEATLAELGRRGMRVVELTVTEAHLASRAEAACELPAKVV